MKVFILTDLEGAAGVSQPDQAGWNGDNPKKHVAMKLLTHEVNAAVQGVLDVDPNAEVVVLDEHGSGGIDVLELHEEAKLILRGPISPPYFLDSTFDGLFVVGQHARAGTLGATLCHTSSLNYEYVKLNGVEVGEFGCWAFMAGELGVPVALIAGDDKAVAEAKELIPGIVGVAVKQCLGYEAALHLSPRRAQKLIRAAAAEACRNIGSIPPFRSSPPYELEIRCVMNRGVSRWPPPGTRILDPRTVVYTGNHTWELPI
jgi:D-amino peptidase